MLAEGEAMARGMQDRPEDLTDSRTETQTDAMKEKADDGADEPARVRPMQKVPVPQDIRPSPETMERLTGLGLTQEDIDRSVSRFLTRCQGLDTVENWQDRLDNRWMVKERVPTAQHGDLAGVPFPDVFKPDERVHAVWKTLKMPDAEKALVIQQFYNDSRAATGFKALSNDWHAQMVSFLIRADLRYRQSNKRSGPAI